MTNSVPFAAWPPVRMHGQRPPIRRLTPCHWRDGPPQSQAGASLPASGGRCLCSNPSRAQEAHP